MTLQIVHRALQNLTSINKTIWSIFFVDGFTLKNKLLPIFAKKCKEKIRTPPGGQTKNYLIAISVLLFNSLCMPSLNMPEKKVIPQNYFSSKAQKNYYILLYLSRGSFIQSKFLGQICSYKNINKQNSTFHVLQIHSLQPNTKSKGTIGILIKNYIKMYVLCLSHCCLKI